MGRLIGAFIRLVISAVVLLIVGAIIPGFSVGGFGNAIIVALVIAVLGYLLEQMLKSDKKSSRGLVGFIISAVIIYIAQFVVSAFTVTVIGALLAALVIGIIDMFVPTVFDNKK